MGSGETLPNGPLGLDNDDEHGKMCKRTVIYYPRESVASLMCPIGFDYRPCLSS
jgi:hypothetical protein